jgi:hypothetical protein
LPPTGETNRPEKRESKLKAALTENIYTEQYTSFGLPVDQLIAKNDDLLDVAALHAGDINAVSADVAAIIFPSALSPPTDAIISAVSTKLMQFVRDLEARLLGVVATPGTLPITWQMLSSSGFLREPDLVDFILARVAEDRLDAQSPSVGTTFVAKLLDHQDSNVVQAARVLLATDSLHRRSAGRAYLMFPPELLHKLSWRIVAALEVIENQRSLEYIAAARRIISEYDEAETASAAARKIVHFLGSGEDAELLDPEVCGIHLFVAKIASEVNLEHDHVLRLVDCASSAPLTVLLSLMGLSREDIASRLLNLRGQTLTPREAALFDQGYDKIDRHAAHAQIASWSAARANYLAFGRA